MRKPTFSAWKTLGKRVEQVSRQEAEPRITGLIVRSPRLVDGSVELRCGLTVFAMPPEQIERLRAMGEDGCGAYQSDLPVASDRIPMTEAQFAEYCAFIQTRKDMQHSRIITR